MSLHPVIKAAVERGIIVKAFATTNNNRYYKILTHSNWAKKYTIPTTARPGIIDALRHIPVELDPNIDTIEYLYMPKDFNFRLFLSSSKNILDIPNFFENTRNALKVAIYFYQQYICNIIKDFKKQSLAELKDSYFLRYYPSYKRFKSKKQILNEIFKDIDQRFFIVSTQTKENQPLLPACIKIGLSDIFLNSTNKKLMDCCKRKWFSLIKNEREKLITSINYQIKKTKLKKIKNKNKAIHQLNEYKKLLNQITINCLQNSVCIKDIISFWPPLMQPKPDFLYER